MNYISLINNFWLRSEEHDFRPIDIALYFYLLKIANGLSWKPSFKRNNKEIMAKLGINSHHTFNDTRNRLKMAGLIDFTTYKGKALSTYSIVVTLAKNADVSAKVTADVSAKVSADLNKTKTENKEKEKRKETTPMDLGLKFYEEKKVKKEIPPPSIEEVTAICVKKGMSEDEAKRFYYYYDAQGWVTSTGQKIKRIDSMVNRWLNNGKQKIKDDGKYKDNATKKQERNDEIARDIISRYM